MNDFILACGSCLAAGIMTTLHPCPVSTNIASVSFLSGLTSNKNKSRSVIAFFVIGYLISYLSLGIIISSGLLSIPSLSLKLQGGISVFMGPILIILGMILSDILKLQKFYRGRPVKYLQSRKWGATGSLLFGIIVALSFCPATAAIFFGLLVPQAIRYNQMILFPVIYAFGAALPVFIISALIAKGVIISNHVKWIRILPVISGWILIIIGIYLSIRRIYLV
jgi:cytochrome c-type biogenesis protein